jgi:biotin transport system substrate-specific component
MLITNKIEQLCKGHTVALSMGISLAGSILLALLARLSIPVPFSPVPITGQTFGVLFLGGILGSRLATLSVIFYIIEGINGLPVFAGGSLGPLYLFGPTGGYILGFIPAAYIVGYLSENGLNKKLFTTIIAMTIGISLIFIFGVSWLSISAGFNTAISIGLIPYLPGAVIKISLAAISAYSIDKLSKQ